MSVRDRLHMLTARLRRPEAPLGSRNGLHDYWRNPPPDENAPHLYLEGAERSQYLVELMQRQVGVDGQILEIGSNVGRNLHFLRAAGFSNLTGIEINEAAVKEMHSAFPDLADATIHVGPIEDLVEGIPSKSFDAVFTMAVLEHVHLDSDWIFAEIVRICRGVVITIEDEVSAGSRHVRRNYRRVFTGLGMKQVHKEQIDLEVGLPVGFVARVFSQK